MPKHLLNGAQISTIFKQMRRKAVPERMRRNILLDVCFFLIVLDNFPESLAAHTFAGYIDEKRMLGRNCNHFRPDSFYVLTQCLKRFRINRYDAHLFPAFAANETSGKANVVDIQPNQFADPDTSRIQNLKHGFIPAALHFRNLGLLQEKFNLFARRLKELEQKKLEAENSEIVEIVRGMSVSLTDLPTLLQTIKSGGTLGQNVPKSDPTDKEDSE